MTDTQPALSNAAAYIIEEVVKDLSTAKKPNVKQARLRLHFRLRRDLSRLVVGLDDNPLDFEKLTDAINAERRRIHSASTVPDGPEDEQSDEGLERWKADQSQALDLAVNASNASISDWNTEPSAIVLTDEEKQTARAAVEAFITEKPDKVSINDHWLGIFSYLGLTEYLPIEPKTEG